MAHVVVGLGQEGEIAVEAGAALQAFADDRCREQVSAVACGFELERVVEGHRGLLGGMKGRQGGTVMVDDGLPARPAVAGGQPVAGGEGGAGNEVGDPRVIRQAGVGAGDGLAECAIRDAGQRHDDGGERRLAVAGDDGLDDLRLGEQRRFDPLRRDVAAERGDQQVLAPALQVQVTVAVEAGEVAGRESIVAGRGLPGVAEEGASAHGQFAVFDEQFGVAERTTNAVGVVAGAVDRQHRATFG